MLNQKAINNKNYFRTWLTLLGALIGIFLLLSSGMIEIPKFLGEIKDIDQSLYNSFRIIDMKKTLSGVTSEVVELFRTYVL